jgi:MFS family permease
MLVISFAVGWFVMPLQAVTMTIVAASTTDASRGRVGGTLNAVTQTASIASMALAGIFADVIGMRPVFYIGGAFAILAAVVAWALFRWSPAPAEQDSASSPGSETGGATSLPHPPVGVAPG